MYLEQRGEPGPVVLALLGFLGEGAEGRRFLQFHAHVQAEQAQRAGHQEWNAPAPVQHLSAAQQHVERGHGSGAGDVAAQRAELQPAAHQAAVAVGGILGDEGGRTAVLAAGGESLHHTCQQQQHRCPDADALVGGNQADRERAQRHQDHGERQHFLAPITVAERAEHQAAEWTHQECHGEGGEGGDHLCRGVAGREEHLADGDGQIAVDTEVEPLHGIAKCGGAHGALEHGLVDDGDLIDLQVAAAFEPAEVGMGIGRVLHRGSLVGME